MPGCAGPDVTTPLAANGNARPVEIEIRKDFGSFDNYIWSFVDHKPVVNKWTKMNEIPAKTELSDRISKDLKNRGLKFVGSTIVYAYLQAAGLVIDHITDCYRYPELAGK